jgi:hypothetical protein
MEHFVTVVMEKQETKKLDESVFPLYETFDTEQDTTVMQIPLPRELNEAEADEYANKLANYLFAEGYEDFDIIVGDDAITEETYDDDNEFFEAYGVMWFNEDEEYGKAPASKKVLQLVVNDIKKLNKEMDYANRGGYDEDVRMIGNRLKDLHKIAELVKDGGYLAGVDTSVADEVVDYYDKAGEPLSMAKEGMVDEAEYQGRKVKLGKPMQGDVKKFKVYVRDPKTKNVKKVNFGDKKSKIKKSNPARRRSFRARHNCDNPGPRTKARYWSCRKW